ncbi:Serine carboxypeptidase-like 2 [Acorus gramineus]|uniref:Serine carboxypeptidase-like 2 n=1 Tax=Acorus gramineus TaxID=55184 RepID=A0AAV8ZYR8_ACOGR|nr:Serine carboxypeptidase-like 2 [Acorus gramineus]
MENSSKLLFFMLDMEDGRAKHLNLKSAKKRCRGQYLEPMNSQCAEDVKAMQYSYGFMLSYYWANDKTVREALYIKKGTVKEWIRCNKRDHYVSDISNSLPYHFNVTTRGYRAFIYSGDHDMQLPHLGTQAAIKSLNYSIIDHWRPFTIDGQVAGFTRSYANNLTFALVKKMESMGISREWIIHNQLYYQGGGHTCPETRPKESYAMFESKTSHDKVLSSTKEEKSRSEKMSVLLGLIPSIKALIRTDGLYLAVDVRAPAEMRTNARF